jgi:glycerophosphodiester phosphodiesterase family protein
MNLYLLIMKRILLLIYISVAWTACLFSQQTVGHILKNFRESASKSVLVVSHRADWRNAPENSLQAIRNCIDMGVDMVEIDLKKTKDGHLILMHDRTIDRTTTGKGKPEDYTLAELRQFRMRNGAGHKTAHQIPTFEEVMILCKGKIMVNVDKGYDYFKDTYSILEKTGTIDQCVMKAGLPYERVKAENGDVLDKMIFMPVVNLHEENAETIIDGYLTHMKPEAFELVFDNDGPDVQRLIKKVRDSGARIFINSLWPELCGGHDDDRAVELRQPDESWGWIIGQGAKLIQTDRPVLLLEYLKSKRLHE